MKRVALIFATDSEGKLLLGKRRDNGRWTLPGGHVKESETDGEGAERELYEETGLGVGTDFDIVDERELNGVHFTTFKTTVDGTPTSKNDPDDECEIWAFFDVSNGVPKELDLQGPKDKDDNIVTDHFGLAKMQQIGGFPKLGIERRQESPIIHGDKEANTKAKQIGWHLRTAAGMDSSPKSKEDTDYWGHETLAGSHGAQITSNLPVTTGFVHSNENVHQRWPKKPLSPTSDLATQLHEDFHKMMGRIEQKHGIQARQNLAYNLWHSIPLEGTAHHYDYGAHMAMNLPTDRRPEESLASLHNYMNDPAARDEYHEHYGHGNVVRESAQNQIKRAFQHVVQMAKKVDPRWMKRRYSQLELRKLAREPFSPPPAQAKPIMPENIKNTPHSPETVETDALTKMQRLSGFPKLGVENRRETYVVHDPLSLKSKNLAMATRNVNEMMPEILKRIPENQRAEAEPYLRHVLIGRQVDTVNGAAGVSAIPTKEQPSVLSYAKGNAMRPEIAHLTGGIGPKSDLAVEEHENLHNMLNRVHAKYGLKARLNLAQNLLDSVHVTNRRALADFFAKRYRMEPTHPFYNEEMLATLHNYLNDPNERDYYHDSAGHISRERIKIHNALKLAHRQIQNSANQADEKWLSDDFIPEEQKNPTPKFSSPPPAAKPTAPAPKPHVWPTPPAPLTATPRKAPKRAGKTKPKSQQLDLFKAEEDEVMRMLALPNAAERRMALKLGTVNDKHLLRAFYDEDPAIRYAALNHPAMSHESLMGLMRMPQSENLQLLGMNHPQFHREHLDALYDHHAQNLSPAIQDAIVASDKLHPELIEKMHQNGHATRALIARADVPDHVIRETIEKHFTPGHDTKGPHRQLVIEALKHAKAPTDLVEKAMREGDDGIKLAAAASPGMPADLAENILRQGHVKAGNPMVRAALVGSHFATARHLDLGVDDLHPLVRAAVFKTKSPLLNEKHVDRAIEKGHPHDIVIALKSKAANKDHLAKLAQHKDPAISTLYMQYLNKTALKKWEAGVADWKKNNSLIKSNLTSEDTNSDIVRDMLGYNHHLMSTFDAAKFLIAGHTPTLEQTRKALWEHDGDAEKAALAAHGLDVSEGNLRALRAVHDLRQHKKGDVEPITAQSVTAGVPEGQTFAESVERAFKDRFVFPVKLGGKHSEGTLLARDTTGAETYLLKPGSGGLSPAAGDHDDPVSQSRREAVFWHVADHWGLGEYLPETNLLLIDGQEYACMKLLPWKYKTLDDMQKKEKFQATRLLQPYMQSGTLHKWAVLDYVLGNPDRHANNLMVDASGDTTTPDVKLIDHGSALAGDHFDPAHDENSFVPFYLRAWVIGPFNTLSVEQKLKVMPRVDDHVADDLHQWVSELHAHELQAQLLRYGVDPEPALARLAKLKMLMSEQPIDLAINKLWVTT